MKLKLSEVSVRLANQTILEQISLQIPEGQFVSVLGPSGCGKSTLLKAIAGILEINQGVLEINGRDAVGIPVHKRKAVIVFQDIRLFPHMSIAENIGFSLKMQGKAGYDETINTLLMKVQLEGLGKRKPSQLSGGQQQRVALARALAAEPDILLLDEPFSGLDENLRDDMRILVQSLHSEFKMTTIMVTHDKSEALGMSDMVVIMEKGRILQAGSPQDIYARPASLRVGQYLGDAAFIRGIVKSGKFECDEFSVCCGLKDGSYTAMVRPNSLTVVKGTDFRLVYKNYMGKETNFIFEHCLTGRRIKYRGEDEEVERGALAGLCILPDKIIFFENFIVESL